METIEIYCKANKRNRDGKTTSVCAHIIKQGERYEESVYAVQIEGNGIKLELAALMNALLDEEAQETLKADINLHLYVHNEYILKTLMRWQDYSIKGNPIPYDKEEKYKEEWKEIGGLINRYGSYQVSGLEKKYRDETNEEVVKYMAHLNRLVCKRVNSSI